MGLISLPTLRQRIEINTNDMLAAEAAADRFGTKFTKQSAVVDKATSRLKMTQEEYRKEVERLEGGNKKAGASFDDVVKGVKRTDPVFRQVRKDTEELSAGFLGLVQRLEKSGNGFNGVEVAVSRLKIPAIIALVSAASQGFGALTAATGAIVAQFGPMIGVTSAALPIFLSLGSSALVLSGALQRVATDAPNVFKTLTSIKDAGAKGAEPGIIKSLKTISPLLDVIRVGYKNLGVTIGETFAKQAKELVRLPGITNKLGSAFASNNKLVATFGKALAPLVNVFLNLQNAAAPVAQLIADDFVHGANSASKFTDNTARLTAFFLKGYGVTRSFFGSVKDLGIAIKNTFAIGAKSIGIDFVGGLRSGSKHLRELTESTKGKNAIAKYFKDAGPVIKEMGLLIKEILKDFFKLGGNQDLAAFLKQLRTEALPALFKLADGVTGNMLPAIGDLITLWIKFNDALTFSPFIATIDGFAKLAISILDVAAAVPGLGPLLAVLLTIKTSSKGLGLIAKTSGLSGLVKGLKDIGPAGKAGQKGIAGFIQGVRGASGESKTFTNVLGKSVKSTVSGVGKSFSKLGSGIKTASQFSAASLKSWGNQIVSITSKAGTSLKTFGGKSVSALKTFGTVIGGVAKAGIAKFAAVLPVLGNAIKTVTLAVKAFTLSLLTNPVFLIIAAIVALVVAIVLLWKNSETFRNIVTAVWDAVRGAVAAAVDWIVNTAVPWIVNAWNTIVLGLQILWGQIQTVWNAITNFLSTVFKAIATVVTTYFNIYRTVITTVLNAIWTVVSTVWNAIVTAITTYLNVIKTIISAVWNSIKVVIDTAVQLVRAVITGNFGAIPGIVSGALTKLIGIASGAFGKVLSAIKNGISSILSTVSSLRGKIVDALGNVGTLLLNAGKAIVQGLINGLLSKLKDLRDAAGSLASAIGKFFPGSPVKEGPLKVLNRGQAGSKIVQMLADGVAANNSLVAQVRRQAQNVGSALNPITQQIRATAPAVATANSSLAASQPAGIVSKQAAARQVASQPGTAVSIGQLNITVPVVQDLNDPKVAKEVAGTLHDAIDDFVNAHK